MTREEAIYELKHIVGNINYDPKREEIYFTDKWVQAYEMAISALREQSQWISVKERLLEAYMDVLAYRESGCEVECCIDIQRNFWLKDPTSEYLVTHWMPLPEPPKECDSK